MGVEQFKVFYIGQLIEGATHKKVAIRFAQTFKVPIDKARQIVTSPKQVLLKSSLTHAKAYQMKLVLERMGMKVWLERMSSIGAQKAVNTKNPQHENQQQGSETEEFSWSLEPLEDEVQQRSADGIELQNLSQVVGKDIKR